MPSQQSNLRLQQVLLEVKNIDLSLALYTEKLGFKLHYDFSPEYAVVLTPNKVQIGLMPNRVRKGRKMLRGQPVALEFGVDNVDRWYRKLRSLGTRFSEAPKDRPWGEREARFKDPDGYGLVISSPTKKP